MLGMECTRRGRGTIYRPVSNISSRSTHSSADLVRTKSLRATIKYPLEQPVGSDLRSILSGPRFTILSMAKTRPRDRFARLTKISVQMDLPPFLSSFFFWRFLRHFYIIVNTWPSLIFDEKSIRNIIMETRTLVLILKYF